MNRQIASSRVLLFFALLISVIITPVVYGQNFGLLGTALWSGAQDVQVVGDYAYCAFANGLVVLNVADSTSPQFVSRLALDGNSQSIFLDGSYAFIASGYGGLYVVDITNPPAPSLTGSWIGDDMEVLNVKIYNDTAYVATSRGLYWLDVSNPDNPTEIDRVTLNAVYDVWVRGDYIYLATYPGVEIIQNVDPRHHYTLSVSPRYVVDMFIRDNYIYLGEQEYGFELADISDPSNPFSVGYLDTDTWGNKVTGSGNYAFISGMNSGLDVIDITNPASPVSVATYQSGGAGSNAFIDGNLCYFSDRKSGIDILDISNPDSVSLIGRYAAPGPITAISSGSYAAIGDKMMAVNIVNPDSTVFLGQYEANSPITALNIFYDFAYIGLEHQMRILSIYDPGSPDSLGTYIASGNVDYIYVSGNYAYIMENNSEPYSCYLDIVDISNRHTPFSTGICWVSPFDDGLDMVVSGNYAYIRSISRGMVIVDISDRTAPTEAGSYYFAGERGAIALDDTVAIASTGEDLYFFNVSNRHTPQLITTIPDGQPRDLAVNEHLLLVADKQFGIHVYDIINPTAPTSVMVYGTSGDAKLISHLDNHLFSYSDDHALYKFSYYACRYIPGDFNYNGVPNGIDVTYMVSFFKGGPLPPLRCYCPPHGSIYPAGDVNGSCQLNGIDVTYFVAFLKGGPRLRSCADCPGQ